MIFIYIMINVCGVRLKRKWRGGFTSASSRTHRFYFRLPNCMPGAFNQIALGKSLARRDYRSLYRWTQRKLMEVVPHPLNSSWTSRNHQDISQGTHLYSYKCNRQHLAARYHILNTNMVTYFPDSSLQDSIWAVSNVLKCWPMCRPPQYHSK